MQPQKIKKELKKKEELGLFVLPLFKGGEGRAWDSGRRLGTMLFCKSILSDS